MRLGTKLQVSSILGTCYILHHRATSQPNGAQHWLQRPQAKKAPVSHCLPEAHGPQSQRSWRCCQQIIHVRTIHSVSSKKFMGKSLAGHQTPESQLSGCAVEKMMNVYFIFLFNPNKQTKITCHIYKWN